MKCSSQKQLQQVLLFKNEASKGSKSTFKQFTAQQLKLFLDQEPRDPIVQSFLQIALEF